MKHLKLKTVLWSVCAAALLASCTDYLEGLYPTETVAEQTSEQQGEHEQAEEQPETGGTENPQDSDTTASGENPLNPETPATPMETKYAVKIADGIEHGTVAADKTEAAEGETVTLTIAASDGYKVGSVSASDASGSTVALAENYTFAMPKSDVTVTATFEELPPDEFTVTFISGGAAFSQQTVKDGETASKPNNPTKTGYTFADWHTSSDGGETLAEVFDFETAVTENLTLYAKWEANTDTPYQVQHYQQNIENDEYTVVSDDTENLTSTTGGQTNAEAKSYDGFEAQDFKQEEIVADGSTVVKIYYNRRIITLTFSAGGENWGDGTSADKTVNGKYGAAVNAPAIPTKTGYGSSWDKTVQSVFTNDETYTAQYAEGQVNYTVKHLQQNANDDGYTEVASETLSGTTGAQTAAEAKSYEHFTAQPFLQKTIAADGSTEIEIKYNREIVTISFDSDGGSAVAEIFGKYGATYTKPEDPTKQGYTFSTWSADLPDTLVNLSVTALWSPNTDTPYKVEHYQQNIENAEYTIVSADTQTLTGTTDANTNASEKSYDGFTAKSFSQQTIAGDGSTVVKIYYDRKTVTYTFEANGGNWNGSTANKEISGLYGATVTAPANPTRTGYTFAGWNTNIPTQFGVISGESFSLAKTFSATWTANTLSPTVTLESVSTDANLSITESGGTLTATSGFANYRWKIDGTTAQNGTANTYTPDTTTLEAGYHNITLAVTDADGGIWSATAVITVQK